MIALQSVALLALVRFYLDIEEPSFEATSEERFWCQVVLYASLPLALLFLWLEKRFESGSGSFSAGKSA